MRCTIRLAGYSGVVMAACAPLPTRRINRRVLDVMEQLAGDTGGADQRGVGDQLLVKLQNISDSMVTETRQHSPGHGAAAGMGRGAGAGAGAAAGARAAVAANPEPAAQSAAPGNATAGLGSSGGAVPGPKPLDPELLGLAVHVGLPQTPEPMPPLHLYCPASTPYLRLSREGAARGQLLLSSGPPLPRESTALRAAWSKERQLRQDMLSIKVRPLAPLCMCGSSLVWSAEPACIARLHERSLGARDLCKM